MYYYFFIWYFRSFFYKPFLKKMGFLSFIGKPLFIRGFRRIQIGNHVHILPNLRIEAVGKKSQIIINDHVAIAQNVHITAGGMLIIENTTSILANVCITDIDHQYTDIDVNIRKQPLIVKKTMIGENCMIGMGAIILAGTILGKQCVVASNSVVRGSFPDYCVIAGSPAKIIKKYNPLTNTWEKCYE
jgi:acetyltransferase-like isoleucine patch superfamily enzyme